MKVAFGPYLAAIEFDEHSAHPPPPAVSGTSPARRGRRRPVVLLVVADWCGAMPRTVCYRQSVSAVCLRPTATRITTTVYAQSTASPAHHGSGK